MNKLKKISLLLFTIMVVAELVIIFGHVVDMNGMIGASIINISTLAGISFACYVRGSQEDKANRGKLPSGY